jgi:hypothetical protein
MPSYWIIVGSPDDFEKPERLGFTVAKWPAEHWRLAFQGNKEPTRLVSGRPMFGSPSPRNDPEARRSPRWSS